MKNGAAEIGAKSGFGAHAARGCLVGLCARILIREGIEETVTLASLEVPYRYQARIQPNQPLLRRRSRRRRLYGVALEV